MSNLDSVLSLGILILNIGISITLIVVGSTYHVLIDKYSELIIDDYNIASNVEISVGVITFVSCYVVYRFVKEKKVTLILTYCLFILIMYVALLMVGIYEYKRVLDEELKDRFISKIDRNLTEAYYNNDMDIATQFFKFQSVYHCCGIYGVSDYANSTMLPASCCYECKDCWDKFCSNKDDYWLIGCGEIMFDLIFKYASATCITAFVTSSLGIISMVLIPFWKTIHKFNGK